MDLNDYRIKKNLSYAKLGELLGWSKAKAYTHCSPEGRPCMKLIDAQNVVKITEGLVEFHDLINGDC